MEEFLQKFQVPKLVGEQAREYHRLAEVKCSAAVRGLSSTALALICIELACTQLGEPIDKVPVLTVTLNHCSYLNTLDTYNKYWTPILINNNKNVSLESLAVIQN